MPGRVEIDDVQPVISYGAYPAKAVVGEIFPVSAAVWRDGHDAVAATLVVRYLGPRYPEVVETREIRAFQTPRETPRESVPDVTFCNLRDWNVVDHIGQCMWPDEPLKGVFSCLPSQQTIAGM